MYKFLKKQNLFFIQIYYKQKVQFSRHKGVTKQSATQLKQSKVEVTVVSLSRVDEATGPTVIEASVVLPSVVAPPAGVVACPVVAPKIH